MRLHYHGYGCVRRIAALLWISAWASAGTAPTGADDAFYIWQRRWTPAVVQAVEHENTTPLLPLAMELPPRGAGALRRVALNWQALSPERRRVTPVLRVPVQWLGHAELAALLGQEIGRLRAAAPIAGVQLDLDCPERRLSEYGTLLTALHRRCPDVALSATLLPCHLHHAALADITAHLEEVVIQVHGLEIPADIAEPAVLLRRDTALAAVAAADRLGIAYRVALPVYAYRLHFSREDGSIRFVEAEQEPPAADPTQSRLVAPDARLVAGLVRELRAPSRHPHCRGIVWFRLPVIGDRYCWDRDTVATLQRGEVPDGELAASLSHPADGLLELRVTNRGLLAPGAAAITLAWGQARGDFDLLNGFNMADGRPTAGILPSHLTGPAPRPGEAVLVGWFRPKSTITPVVRVVPASMEKSSQ